MESSFIRSHISIEYIFPTTFFEMQRSGLRKVPWPFSLHLNSICLLWNVKTLELAAKIFELPIESFGRHIRNCQVE